MVITSYGSDAQITDKGVMRSVAENETVEHTEGKAIR